MKKEKTNNRINVPGVTFGNKKFGILMKENDDIRIAEAAFFPDPPSYWKKIPNAMRYLGKDADEWSRGWIFSGIRVIASAGTFDGREWLHVSFSRERRLPDYKDLQLVRKDFIGTDKKAIMVFPEESHYVNIHQNCLHLWYSAENPLPDFDGYIPGIGKSI